MARALRPRVLSLLLTLCLLFAAFTAQAVTTEFGDMSFALLEDTLWMTGTLSGPLDAVGVVIYAYKTGESPENPVPAPTGGFIHAVDPQTGRYRIDCPIETDESGGILSEYMLYAVPTGEGAPVAGDPQTVAAAALQSCPLSYTGLTLETLRERALSYAIQYGLADPTPEPEAASTPTPDPALEPMPSATPAATPTPEPTPIAWTPESAQAQAVSVALASFAAAQETQHFAMPAMVEAYLAANARAVEVEGGYACQVSLPNLAGWAPPGITKYKGENPATYMTEFVAALRVGFEALTPETDVLGGVFVHESAEADPALSAAFASLGESMEVWLTKALTDRAAYPALTRLTLDQDGDAAFWKEVDLSGKEIRPVYAAEEKRRTLNQGSKGSAVRVIQQALVDQGYLTGRVDGSYGRQTEAAVLNFEQANGLTVDGRLVHEEQLVLLGIHAPYSLSQTLLEDAGWGDLLTQGWPEYLLALRDIRWQGSVLTYRSPNLNAVTPSLFDQLVAGYLERAYTPDTMASWLGKTIDKLTVPETTVTLPLCLEALVDESPTPMLATRLQADFTDAFANDLYVRQSALENMAAYAASHLQPLALPKNGVIEKPKGSNAEFQVQNGSDQPVYLTLYVTEGPDDPSGGTFAGSVFIRAGGKVTFKLSAGHYNIRYATGTYWYGDTDLFGEKGQYLSSQESYEFVKNHRQTLYLEIEDVEAPDAAFQSIDRSQM